MANKNIDDKLLLVLNFVTNFIQENGFPPSVREICAKLSIKSTATTYYYLEKLQEKGLLKKTKSKNRAIEIVNNNKDNIKNIPLIGKITAGSPILALECIEELIPMPADIFGSDDLFMLNVVGDSMIDAGIYSGDRIIVKSQSYAENGDIVVALIDDEATVKRFFKEKGFYILHPENRSMQDIIVEDLHILGLVTGLIRKY